MCARLTLVFPLELEGCLPQVISLHRETTTIGRTSTCDVILKPIQFPSLISRTHAKIVRRNKTIPHDNNEEYEISDCQSLNGTVVNSIKITSHVLRNGDNITFTAAGRAKIGSECKLSQVCITYRFEVILPVSNPSTRILRAYRKRSLEGSSSPPSKKLKITGSISSSSSSDDIDIQEVKLVRDDDKNVGDNNLLPPIPSIIDQDILPLANANNQNGISDRVVTILKEKDTIIEDYKSERDQIEDQIRCSICSEMILQAAMLSCSHTFCKSCIHKWLIISQSCPICRKFITKKPIKNHMIDSITEKMSEKRVQDKERRKQRLEEINHEEIHNFTLLQQRIDTAKSKGAPFLNISSPWAPHDKKSFMDKIRRFSGRARELFCHSIGLTHSFVANASLPQLITAVHNLNLENDLPDILENYKKNGSPRDICTLLTEFISD